jgi:hypothetical protein
VSQINNQSANDGGFATGAVDFVATLVTSPTVSGAFPGYGYVTQSGTFQSLFFENQDYLKNILISIFPHNPSLTGPWTINVSSTPTFSPGTVTTVTSPAVGSVGVMPFVQNMTISNDPSGLNPTISWTLPTTGPTVNTAGILIADNSAPTTLTNVNPFAAAFLTSHPGENTIYNSVPISGSTTSFTVPTTNNNPSNANFGAPVLQYGHTYSIGIILNNTTPGSTPIPGCPTCTIDSRSVSFFDYTPQNPAALGLPAGTVINLPTTTPVPTLSGLYAGPVYSFNVQGVGPSSVTYIDPVVANGFIYTIGTTDPNFKSVNPVTVVGSGIYSLLVWNGTSFIPEGTLLAGQTFDFTQHGFANGVSEFEITGLDPGVSPTDIGAFVTGLTFMSDGNFTGTMQGITAGVPEPSTWAMMLLGFLGLGFAFRQSGRKVAFA